MTTHRPFILLRDSDLDQIRNHLESALQSWCEKWFPSNTTAQLHDFAAVHADFDLSSILFEEHEYRVADSRSDLLASISVANQHHLADPLFAATQVTAQEESGPVERAVIDSAVKDLSAMLFKAGNLDIEFIARDAAARDRLVFALPGAEGIRFSINANDKQVISCVASAQALRRIWNRQSVATGRTPPRSIKETLHQIDHIKVKVEAQLATAELTVGALASLNVGDVLRLSNRIDDFIEVRAGASRRSLNANLGLSDGYPALQIIGIQPE